MITGINNRIQIGIITTFTNLIIPERHLLAGAPILIPDIQHHPTVSYARVTKLCAVLGERAGDKVHCTKVLPGPACGEWLRRERLAKIILGQLEF